MAKGRRGREKARMRTTRFDEAPVRGEQSDYELLDSGAGEKLERFGSVVLTRPASHALWSPESKDKWKKPDGRFQRSTGGEGRWKWGQRTVPKAWILETGSFSFILKTTKFGHLGLFPEQHSQWTWIENCCKRTEAEDFEVLNLFAYTGGSTMAAAVGGAQVCHVDAAKGVVDWARENARLSGLEDHPIRWIVDDVQVFVKRELRRERRYHGIILDPPSYGRGRKGETWKIEEDLIPLLKDCAKLLADEASFVLLSCHSAGFTPRVLARLLEEITGERAGAKEEGEMLLEGSNCRALPSGCFARWCRGEE